MYACAKITVNSGRFRVFSHVLSDDYRVRTLTLRILRLVAVSERPLRMYLENGLDIALVRYVIVVANMQRHICAKAGYLPTYVVTGVIAKRS